MTSPLNRAARAAQEADGAYRHESGMWMKEGGLVGDSHWQDIARAILEAIREPSSHMTHAAQSESHVAGEAEVDCHGIWASMIDAALSEKPE